MLIDSPTMPPKLLPLEEAEPAKVAPKKRRFWHRRKPNDAEVLRRAIEVIDERGWTAGAWVAVDGSVCLLGAIGVAAVESGRRPYGKGVDFQAQVMGASDKLVGGERSKLMKWNDYLVWKEDEDPIARVKQRLAKMADKADANGGKYPTPA